MRDPVTGFEYPDNWIKSCDSPELLEQAAQGLAVLTASGTILRRGYTTGTTASAACKAAILSLKSPVASVRIMAPCGIPLEVPVSAENGRAECRKYAGDYPGDVTAGVLFIAVAEVLEEGILFEPGSGIGRFARSTPRFLKGMPAITPAPLSCILRSVDEALDETGISGVRVRLEVADGETIAARTLNSRVGVEAGISVLGTTGLVEPWDDHLAASAFERIAQSPCVVLTTGRIGLRFARLRYPERDAILIGSRIGDALSVAHHDAILFGLPALILKHIRPDILESTGYQTVEEFSMQPQFPAIMAEALCTFHKDHPGVHVVIINRCGEIIGESP